MLFQRAFFTARNGGVYVSLWIVYVLLSIVSFQPNGCTDFASGFTSTVGLYIIMMLKTIKNKKHSENADTFTSVTFDLDV